MTFINLPIIKELERQIEKLLTLSYSKQFSLIQAGQLSGGFASFYTNLGAPQALWPSRFTINPDDYPEANFFLEAVYRAGAPEDEGTWNFVMDLYDVTAASTVTNSQISGNTKSSTGVAGYPIIRGTTDFRVNLTSGDRDYIVRYWTDDITHYVDLYHARLIITRFAL